MSFLHLTIFSRIFSSFSISWTTGGQSIQNQIKKLPYKLIPIKSSPVLNTTKISEGFSEINVGAQERTRTEEQTHQI